MSLHTPKILGIIRIEITGRREMKDKPMPVKKYRQNRQKEVAFLLEGSNKYARSILNGAQKYLSEQTNWSVFLRERDKDWLNLQDLLKWEGDGIFARIETKEMAEFIKKKQLPSVDLSAYRLLPDVPFFENNDRSIAKLGADHLISKGVKNFAFCGYSKYIWSRKREEAFREFVEKEGCYYFFDTMGYGRLGIDERIAMSNWVKGLPKPVGIMVCHDRLGLQLLEACRMAEIYVPESVAVLSVDNDDIICELCTPTLTSIILNANTIGYQATKFLDRLMNGEKITQYEHRFDPLGIKVRQSTDILATNDVVVTNALRIIKNNACHGIKVSDVLEAVPLSRRAFEKRFYKVVGRTPHEEILNVKMNLIKRLLTETELSLEEIANRSGYPHPEYMSVVFKREFSVTPSEYRKSNTVF